MALWPKRSRPAMRLHAIHNAMEIKRKYEAVKVAAGKKKYSVPFK